MAQVSQLLVNKTVVYWRILDLLSGRFFETMTGKPPIPRVIEIGLRVLKC